MRKFEFRLEAVLKVRKLKEENCRMELGQLLIELNKIEDQINYDKNEIDNYYSLQESALKNGLAGNQLQTYSMLIDSKYTNVKMLEEEKIRQEKLIEEKKEELAILKGELKVMENLREKSYDEYRKALNKEIDQKVEEQTQNWLNHKDRT